MQTIQYNGKKITLLQDAHCDVPIGANYDYMAIAQDSDGNKYVVKWCKHEDLDMDLYDGDESCLCNWDYPMVSEL